MFWKMFAVLCLISASYFAYSHLTLAKVTSVIPASSFVERATGGSSTSGNWYRHCSHNDFKNRIECDEWAKAYRQWQ